MSDKISPGTSVSFTTAGRYAIPLSGTLVRYETLQNGEWAIVKLADNSERKTRPSTLRTA